MTAWILVYVQMGVVHLVVSWDEGASLQPVFEVPWWRSALRAYVGVVVMVSYCT